jgi:hypothetical protein
VSTGGRTSCAKWVAAEAAEVAELTARRMAPAGSGDHRSRTALRPVFSASLAADLRDILQRLDWLASGDQVASRAQVAAIRAVDIRKARPTQSRKVNWGQIGGQNRASERSP